SMFSPMSQRPRPRGTTLPARSSLLKILLAYEVETLRNAATSRVETHGNPIFRTFVSASRRFIPVFPGENRRPLRPCDSTPARSHRGRGTEASDMKPPAPHNHENVH